MSASSPNNALLSVVSYQSLDVEGCLCHILIDIYTLNVFVGFEDRFSFHVNNTDILIRPKVLELHKFYFQGLGGGRVVRLRDL